MKLHKTHAYIYMQKRKKKIKWQNLKTHSHLHFIPFRGERKEAKII